MCLFCFQSTYRITDLTSKHQMKCWIKSLLAVMGMSLLAIATYLLWFRHTDVNLDSISSVLQPKSLGNVDVNLNFVVHNKNFYPLKFKDLYVDVYDFDNVFVGTLVHKDKTTLPARSRTILPMSTLITPEYEQTKRVGYIIADCILHDNRTKINVRGRVNGLIMGGIKLPIKFGPLQHEIKCN